MLLILPSYTYCSGGGGGSSRTGLFLFLINYLHVIKTMLTLLSTYIKRNLNVVLNSTIAVKL